MALIICPECKKEVSDKSNVCIHCGYPLQTISTTEISSLFEDKTMDRDSLFLEVKNKAHEIKSSMDNHAANNVIATEIISGLAKRPEHYSWIDVKQFCELIQFDKIDETAMSNISEILYQVISEIHVYSDGSSGRNNITPFFYPLYYVLAYTDTESKNKLMSILKEKYHFTQSGYNFIISMFKEHVDKDSTLLIPSDNAENVKSREYVEEKTSITPVSTVSKTSKSDKGNTIAIIVGIILIILFFMWVGGSCSSSSSDPLSGEVRCWYCSKVIINNGRLIHCTHKNLNSYVCDYCGTTNVVK